MQRERLWTEGLVAAFASVAVITLLIYPLREVVPVVSTGVVCTLAVLFVSRARRREADLTADKGSAPF